MQRQGKRWETEDKMERSFGIFYPIFHRGIKEQRPFGFNNMKKSDFAFSIKLSRLKERRGIQVFNHLLFLIKSSHVLF